MADHVGSLVENAPIPPLPAALQEAFARGRRRYALARGFLPALAVVPAVGLGLSPSVALAMVGALALIGVVGAWRSRAGLAGALWGSALGVAPLVMGAVVGDACTCAGGMCLSTCAFACAGTSATLGAGAGYAFGRQRSGPGIHGQVEFALAAVAGFALGMVVCPMVGVGSVVGAAVGVVLAAPPAALWALRQQKALA